MRASECVYADDRACMLLRMKLFIKYVRLNGSKISAHRQIDDDTFDQIESKRQQHSTALTKEYARYTLEQCTMYIEGQRKPNDRQTVQIESNLLRNTSTNDHISSGKTEFRQFNQVKCWANYV